MVSPESSMVHVSSHITFPFAQLTAIDDTGKYFCTRNTRTFEKAKTSLMEKLKGLSHLFMAVFLYNFSSFMVIPAITDVTMSALCPGKNECSMAIYLTGLQQTIVGLGTLVMTPMIGKLSDTYGRKVMLTLPMTLSIFPLVILAYDRSRYFVYAYIAIRTLTAMLCEGTVLCLALAYVADNIREKQRASSFGILTGISSAAFVGGNFCTRFLSPSSTFQVAAAMAVVSVVYMRVFLKETIISVVQAEDECLLENKKPQFFKTMPSITDTISLLRTSPTFSQVAIVAFFSSLAEAGLFAALLYYLKAEFQYDKDQFADLMVINGIAGTISQMIVMPLLAPMIKEEKLLSIGLFFSCAHMLLYSFAWSSWVPYVAAMFSVLAVFANPCLRSIASKQVGSSEQGKAQGCITGICSFSNVISPLVYSPLTALFLSETAPFHFPGFSIMCAGFAVMIAFIQSVRIRPAPDVEVCVV